MIDGHIHIERGSYTLDWINQFIKFALERGISEIHLLEHSHRYKEFAGVYKTVSGYNEYQKDWLDQKMILSLDEYKSFVLEMRKFNFPIKVKFGLEVCYFEQEESSLKDILSGFDWDFVTGSVHWIDGWGFDHSKEFWKGKDIDTAYKRYYEIMENLIKSGLFDIIAHPDSIKCFGYKPSCDLSQTYGKIADLLNKHSMYAEQSAGLKINYGFNESGMNREMFSIFKSKGVKLLTASDAHIPQDVGRYINEMQELI